MEKIKLSGVAETLLLTVYARYLDAISAHPILNDQESVRIKNALAVDDWAKYEVNMFSRPGTIARLYIMDREIRNYLQKYPQATVIAIGAGLDNRFARLDNGSCTWYDLDLPEVIELRQKLIPPHPRVHPLPYSMFDPLWTKEVAPSQFPYLIISEGVLMYFTPTEVTQFLKLLCDNFPHFQLHLDLMSKYAIEKFNSTKTISKLQAPAHWGVTDGSEVVQLEPRLRQLSLVSFDEMLNSQLNWWQKLIFLYARKYNNRLGIYEKK